MIESRCGHFVRQIEGYNAFYPKGLPPDPPLTWDNRLQTLLSDADRAYALCLYPGCRSGSGYPKLFAIPDIV